MRNIRLAKKRDLDTVVSLVCDATRHMVDQGIFQWDDIYPDRSILNLDIRQMQMHVIETAGQIVGCVTLNEEQAPEYKDVPWAYGGRILVIHRLTIAPIFQGRKLASQMMDFSEKFAASSGDNTIRLDAFTLNPHAVALYENRGYRKAGTVRLRKGIFYCFETDLGLDLDT